MSWGPSHELAIVADFVDLDGLDTYTRHPAHAEVLRISAPVKVSLATVDFESLTHHDAAGAARLRLAPAISSG